MHTKDKLAAALRDVDLNEMADKAATGYYHDFLSPLDLPEMTLVNELHGHYVTAVDLHNFKRAADIKLLRERVINGDFDASEEESDEWAESEEGQDALCRLIDRR